jgi:hypothetical protein
MGHFANSEPLQQVLENSAASEILLENWGMSGWTQFDSWVSRLCPETSAIEAAVLILHNRRHTQRERMTRSSINGKFLCDDQDYKVKRISRLPLIDPITLACTGPMSFYILLVRQSC